LRTGRRHGGVRCDVPGMFGELPQDGGVTGQGGIA
jgi:hypothetical protein